MAKILRIYFVDVRVGERAMQPPTSPFSYIHARWIPTYVGIITAYMRAYAAHPIILLPYHIYPILYQHLYKYSTRKY